MYHTNSIITSKIIISK